MRVIAGTARSLPLKTPEGMDTRPTTDRIKETLFNMLQTYIPDCVFVDIFSGSGGIGIEALSRGARKAYFIENAPKALACIEDNLAFTKMKDRAIVLKQDACAGLTGIYEKHVDVIFMDPPYDQEQERRVLEQLRYAKYVSEETLILVEASLHTDFSYAEDLGFEVIRDKEKTPLFSVEERVKILKEATKDLPNVQIDSFSGLLVDYAREKDLHVIVRGLRAITDFEYELQMAQTNRMLSHEKIDTVFLTTSLEYAYLSSSAIKQIASFDGDITPCVPDFVADLIYDKYRQKKLSENSDV